MANNLRILIIDGSPLHIRVLRHLLENSKGPYHISQAETLLEGYEILREKKIDLVLLDLHLPGTKEYQLLREFRQKQPDIPLIVTANRDNEVLFRQSLRSGISDFLIKGEVEARQLRRSIALAMEKHRQFRELFQESREFQTFRETMDAVERISGRGHFMLNIVTGEMEWSPLVYQLLEVRPTGTVPGLSDYLNRVHYQDRQQVSRVLVGGKQENSRLSVEHRIITDGHRIRRVQLYLQHTPIPSNGRIYLIGSVGLVESPKLLGGQAGNREPAMSVSFPPEIALSHHRTCLELTRELSKLLTEEHAMQLMARIRVEHEILVELILRSIREDIRLLPESIQDATTFHLKDLQNHIENYFWLRAVNNESLPVFRQETTHIKEVLGNYLLLFSLFSAWIDLIFFEEEQRSTKPVLSIRAAQYGKDQYRLELEVNNLPRPAWDRSAESSAGKYPPDSAMANNVNLIRFAVGQELCETDFRVTENQSVTELLYLPINPIGEEDQFRVFTERSPLRILLAEDHFLNRINIQKVLEQTFPNLHLQVVSNGREAVDRIVNGNPFDLILLDLQMPVMDGIEAARQIRIQSDTPIIGLISQASHQELTRAGRAGITTFLEKPLNKTALKKQVQELLLAR